MSQLLQKAAMVKRWLKILTGKTEVAVDQGPGRVYEIGHIAGYYNDLTGKVSPNTLIDADGIPVSAIAGGKRVRFPISIFQYGLGCYDLSILEPDKAQRHLQALRTCANWALEAQRADGSWDSFGPIGSEKYSVSSMAQGEGCSMLLRAWTAFGEERYKNAALKAADYMLVDMAYGGVSCHEGGELYLEEYPQQPRRSVMNGWIFSLFGLYDASLVDERFREPFIRSTATLRSHLQDYDAGFWTYYDLEHRIASPAYHSLHIAQLRVLGELSEDSAFGVQATKYERYQDKSACRRKAIVKKAFQKIAEKSDAVVVQ